jgi:hypothetical protein
MRSHLRTGCKPYRIAFVLVSPPNFGLDLFLDREREKLSRCSTATAAHCALRQPLP